MAKKKRDEKDWSKGILAAILVPLLGVAVTLFAVFYEKPKIFLYNPSLDQAVVFLVEGEYDKAIEMAGQAVAIEADNPLPYFVMYSALELSDRPEEAIEALRKGETQIKKRATGGKEVRDVLAAAEVSSEDGFIAVAESFRRFEQKPLAYKFLQLCVKVFEDAERFVAMLVDLAEEMGHTSYFEGSVYQVFDVGMTWYEAKAYCESIGGHLATVTSQAEQDYIMGQLTGYNKNIYWLGGTDATHEGQWEWVTGEPFEYTNWDYGEPNNDHGIEHYLHIYRTWDTPELNRANKWNDLSYDAHGYNDGFYSLYYTGFICEWTSGYQSNVKSIPGDAVYFEGRAYKAFDIGMTWHEAKAYCESIRGHLTTITSQAEQDFIEGLIENQTKNIYWLGGTDEVHEGYWEWVTGEPFEYSNWASWEPDNGGGVQHYLHLYRVPYLYDQWSGTVGKWSDISFDAYVHEHEAHYFSLDTVGFICEWSSIPT